jgi:ion channel
VSGALSHYWMDIWRAVHLGWTARPNAFTGMTISDSPALASTMVYFSFGTLTTAGSGDIAPLHPIALSLCNLEAMIGQLYPATLLARLVTLEIEGEAKH